jgi:lipopolysaccharide transport system ATP-binding protein
MSSEFALKVSGLGKQYQIYERPRHRLLQMLFRGRRKYFREFWALRDVGFEVGRGETVAIIGRNGSGKSTLLQMLCGTLTPTEGAVQVNGRVAALLELGAGFNPQFTGRENVFLNATILGLTPQEIERRFPAIVEFAEIGDFIDQPVSTYSSGMFVRLAFSVAIQVDPDLLVVDEALAVGDAQFQAKCMNRIRALQDSGVSILFVSHDMTSVRKLCDRAVWLENGRVRQMGDVAPVTAAYLEQVFSGANEADGSEKPSLHSKQARPESAVVPAGMRWVSAISHWGSNKNLIKSVELRGANRQTKFEFLRGEPMEVVIDYDLPEQLFQPELHLSFSLKSVEGIDLVCRSTADEHDRVGIGSAGPGRVSFSWVNSLNTGKYLLAISLEDRSSPSIRYLEYIEGATVFASVSPELLYGMFVPEVGVRFESCPGSP